MGDALVVQGRDAPLQIVDGRDQLFVGPIFHLARYAIVGPELDDAGALGAHAPQLGQLGFEVCQRNLIPRVQNGWRSQTP